VLLSPFMSLFLPMYFVTSISIAVCSNTSCALIKVDLNFKSHSEYFEMLSKESCKEKRHL